MESVTVITLTLNRPELLCRAIASVARQIGDALDIEHLILVDNCERTRGMLETQAGFPQNLFWRWMPRVSGERSGPGRCARLRNYGVRAARTRWISFLDDDNEFAETHLSELISCATQNKLRAVHSHRLLLNRDGAPYLEPRFPWCLDPEEGRRIYEQLCQRGVFSQGSCIVRDRADPIGHPDPVRMVDTGEWLLARELLLEVPFEEHFTPLDEATVTGEDDKLLQSLIRRGEPIGCTNQPTLRYYLGGYSNNLPHELGEIAWR